MEDKKKNGQRERPEKGSSDKKEKGPTTDPQEGARKKGEKSDPEGSSPEERVKKERPTKEREAGSSGKKEEGIPDAKEEKGKNRTATANKGPGEKNKERTDDKGTASSSSSKSEKNPIEKPGKREKDNAAPDQKEPLPLLERSFQAPSLTDTGGLNPIGKQPGLIEFPKGKEGIYVRSIVSYGPRYRSLKPEGDRGLVEHRNQNESPSDGFHYGIESGFRWRNGLAAGLGLERTSYGSEFSFNDSETLRDSTFSTDTNYIYLDSTYIDPNTGDTITVIVDSIPDSVQNDTTVTQRDSSYEHQYQIRYRYITVPLHLSYRFELSDRFTVVPTLGLGLNFLTRASTGWTRAESHEKVRHRYPSKDPPFKRFALSFRGRVALRYGLADRWEIGAGIRYSRFLQNIYDEDMGMRELPYSYGGSFSVTYLLDLGE